MKESITIKMHAFGQERDTTIVVGQPYKVVPLNSLKMKHRGRICTVIEFDEEVGPERSSVRFHDNNRRGKVDIADLVPLGESPYA